MNKSHQPSPIDSPQGTVAGFLADESGAMLLEYVTLLGGCLLLFSFMINPVPTTPDNLPALQNALMQFSRDAFEALTQP